MSSFGLEDVVISFSFFRLPYPTRQFLPTPYMSFVAHVQAA
ncbi:hypothetical protein [Alysiella crassa]|nr:hypothetical protein [Alysiella crassa]